LAAEIIDQKAKQRASAIPDFTASLLKKIAQTRIFTQ
jgi:hypothetical protein